MFTHFPRDMLMLFFLFVWAFGSKMLESGFAKMEYASENFRFAE
jgi:hypothetical protein